MTISSIADPQRALEQEDQPAHEIGDDLLEPEADAEAVTRTQALPGKTVGDRNVRDTKKPPSGGFFVSDRCAFRLRVI